MGTCCWLILSLVLSCLFGVYEASDGDSDPLYRACVGECKYHGKWPMRRLYGVQESVSVAFSALNLAMHFHGWVSFLALVYYKLPLKPDKRPFYEYVSLWNIYGLLSMNAWFWSAVFHIRHSDLTEKLDYSSGVALLGFSMILAIIRSLGMRQDAAKVMVAAPLIAFTTTHILFIHNYGMDQGWNMKVSTTMGMTQLLTWSIWGVGADHPCRWKLWIVVMGNGLAMVREMFEFPPYRGLVDINAVSHALTAPLTYIWWNFIKDDAEYRTSIQLKKVR